MITGNGEISSFHTGSIQYSLIEHSTLLSVENLLIFSLKSFFFFFFQIINFSNPIAVITLASTDKSFLSNPLFMIEWELNMLIIS